MSLAAGDKLGPYEILALIGAGGMGEVYRARDPRLGRDVAIKVSAERFSERFDREARAVAALNHPNICTLYDVGPNYLVMEYIEGESPKGPLPLEEALRIAKQIAEALNEAHEKGITHRDLKPGNIKIKPDGAVKVLDFGLAKMAAPPEGTSQIPATQSPTLSMAATQAGVILGTAAYMAPEQAKGKFVDRRADIWAFGVVLHELLTGRRLFESDDVTETLAAVVLREPHWDGVPPEVQRLLKKCLEKDPKKRLRDIGDAWELLDEPPAAVTQAEAPRRTRPAPQWIAGAAAAGLAIGVGIAFWAPWRTEPTPEVIRFQVPSPLKATFGPNAPPVISPDGRKLAFLANAGANMVWVRFLDTLEARPLPGTENAAGLVVWSPDSRSVAYWSFSPTLLKRVDLAGGPPQTLCNTAAGGGSAGAASASWSSENVIIFNNGGLFRVPAGGGDCAPLTTIDAARGETAHRLPSFLPDGRHFMYRRESGRPETTGIYVGSLDDKPGLQSTKRLLVADDRVIYAPSPGSKTGYLLFRRQGTLMAQTFNAAQLELAGDAVPVAEQVGGNNNIGGLFSASATGAIAYRTGLGGASLRLTWFDRRATVVGAGSDPISVTNSGVSFSTDGTQAAFTRTDALGGNQDIWLYDFARAAGTRFTSDPAMDLAPVWSPDDKQIIFASDRDGGRNLYRKASSNVGNEELLFKSNQSMTPTDWSRDGGFLLFDNQDTKTGADIFVLTNPSGNPGDVKVTPYLNTPSNERQARFSPDGHFVAYTSDLSGTNEVYVQTFPDAKAGKRVPVSQGGGTFPHWRRDGKELFYLSSAGGAGGTMMSVEVTLTPQFTPGVPKVLFRAPPGTNVFDVTGDGKKFIKLAQVSASSDAPPEPITIVLNWAAGLKK